MRRWITGPPAWLQVRQIAVPPDPALAELDPGEREAIALAEALRADALIINEKIGQPRSGAPEVTCDWNSARFGRCGRGRSGRPAYYTSADN